MAGGWDMDGFDAALARLSRRSEVPAPPKRPAPVAPGPCRASCCKTPYGHAASVKRCACHPEVANA